MKNLFKKENLKLTIAAALYLIFGALFCVIPVRMYNFLETTLCALLLGVGIVCVLMYALISHDDKPFKMLLYGIIAVVLGVLIIMWSKLFGVILSIIVGYSGTMLVIEYIKNKKQNKKANVTEFIVGIIVAVLSITSIVLVGTKVSKNILSLFFGVICLTQAIYNIIQLIKIIKSKKVEQTEKTQKTEEKTIKTEENSKKTEE